MFILANSVDPDEIPHLCGISSGSSLFAKLLVLGFMFWGFLVLKGLSQELGSLVKQTKMLKKTISGTIT